MMAVTASRENMIGRDSCVAIGPGAPDRSFALSLQNQTQLEMIYTFMVYDLTFYGVFFFPNRYSAYMCCNVVGITCPLVVTYARS